MIVVATMTVMKAQIARFREFERHAAATMKKYGGRIERTIVVTLDTPAEFLKEVHIVSFPDESAFAAYRADASLDAFAHLRHQSVVHTEILIGEEGPSYEA